MIDFDMYMRMHPQRVSQDLEEFKKLQQPQDISIDMTADTIPPEDDFIMCLPSKTMGFDMSKKEWSELSTSRVLKWNEVSFANRHAETLKLFFIKDVVWDDQAFEDLVINPDTKDLVKAVVKSRLREDESLDVIEGKGNGLFILLHG